MKLDLDFTLTLTAMKGTSVVGELKKTVGEMTYHGGECMPHKLLKLSFGYSKFVFEFKNNPPTGTGPVRFTPYIELDQRDFSYELDSHIMKLTGPTKTIPERTLSYECRIVERYTFASGGTSIDGISYHTYAHADMKYIRAQAFVSNEQFRPAHDCAKDGELSDQIDEKDGEPSSHSGVIIGCVVGALVLVAIVVVVVVIVRRRKRNSV